MTTRDLVSDMLLASVRRLRGLGYGPAWIRAKFALDLFETPGADEIKGEIMARVIMAINTTRPEGESPQWFAS